MHTLSKSTYLRGLQCQKSLYLNKYNPELKDPVSASQQAVFDMGHEVGKTARKLFPWGVDATRGDHFKISAAVEYTKRLIDEGTERIYEAAFIYNGVLCYMDILVNENGKWKAYEVKGSTSLKDYYIDDASIQYYIINGSGLELEDISIIYINNQYVRKDALNLNELFIIESVSERVKARQAEVGTKLEECFQTLSLPFPPDIDIGPYCDEPYDCDFKGFCWQHIPEPSVFSIHMLQKNKKFELYYNGITKLKDIPKDFKMGANQWMQVNSSINNEVIIKRDEIKEFVESLNYPLVFLDFESFQPPVPLYKNSRPYQQIVFQYSMHKLFTPDSQSVMHTDFLGTPDNDPRIPFIESLIANTDHAGDIMVYNKSFECGRLKEIAEYFPEYRDEVKKLLSRIVDLMIPFQKRYYYTPGMNGSYSIKQVLPALDPHTSYDELEIAIGGVASAAFNSLRTIDSEEEKQKVRENLLQYCEMDTYAMVRILSELRKVLD